MLRLAFLILIGLQALNCVQSARIPASTDWGYAKQPKKPPTPTPTQTTAQQCGTLGVAAKIFGGGKASFGEYPWLAKLEIKFMGTTNRSGCGGTLISDQWILTAAHCLIDEKNKAKIDYVRAQLGRMDLSATTEKANDVQSSNVFVHPSYDASKNWIYDSALVRLSTPVKLSSTVRTICLPTMDNICSKTTVSASATTVDSCRTVVTAGWGVTEGENSPKVAQEASMTISPRTTCDKVYSGDITEAHLCVGNGKPGVCRGDSGGPLMCVVNGRSYIIGVTSWSSKTCGKTGRPSVFTRVCSVSKWIAATMKENL